MKDIILDALSIKNKDIENIGEYIWRFGKGAKKIVVLACVHGNEVVGLEVIRDFLSEVKKEDLNSVEITFIVANPDAVLQKKRFVDCDMNRSLNKEIIDSFINFKGSDVSEIKRLQYILPYLDGVDYLIDIHSTIKESVPFVYCDNNPENIKVGLHFDVDYIVSPNNLCKKYQDLTSAFDNYADRIGGVGITVEAGHAKNYNSKIALDGLYGFLYKYSFLKRNILGNTSTKKDTKKLLVYKYLIAQSSDVFFVDNNIKNFSFLKKNNILSVDDGNSVVLEKNSFILFPKTNILKGSYYCLLAELINDN